MARAKADFRIAPPYEERLHGILAFATFQAAEDTLRKLEKLRQEFFAAGDKKGVESCRLAARRGRRRAESIGRNARVRAGKRNTKLEIGRWFQIWLETPELFETWLALRKETSEFQKLLSYDLGT